MDSTCAAGARAGRAPQPLTLTENGTLMSSALLLMHARSPVALAPAGYERVPIQKPSRLQVLTMVSTCAPLRRGDTGLGYHTAAPKAFASVSAVCALTVGVCILTLLMPVT